MELYVLRHGIAADLGQLGAQTDAERPLTDEGRRRMHLSCVGMARLGLQVDQVLSSPLVRTRQTAEIVTKALGAPLALAEELEPGCTIRGLQAALEPYLHLRRIMVVGHEPDCSILVGLLMGGGQVEFKKGALARLDLLRIDPGAGSLIWMLAPAVLRLLGSPLGSERE